MAINFTNEKLAKISCNQVCSDHHDVQNLISLNELQRNKGFQVEYFIRPPVTITIEFVKHNLDLFYIQLSLLLGQHRSRGIEVYATTATSQVPCLLAKCFQTPEIFTIVNRIYRENAHLPSKGQLPNEIYSIAGRNMRYCTNIKSIILKILSTEKSSVPCLKFCSIYGKPNGLSHDQMKHFVQWLNGSCIPREPESFNQCASSNHDKIEHLAPVDFTDAITNELMKIPYKLPSGKNIDLTTLDKYISTFNNTNEATDPFTRLPFTNQYKPILNFELKERIDLFWSTNGQSEIDRRDQLRRRILNLP
ncbi:RING finger protein 37 [Blomia tropicalis]|nr:RING finger protein 37 [Blomia tropicalis]